MRLAELRKEKNLSQRDLAKIFNISSGNICDYEKGRVYPNIDRLIAFADFFEVSTDYLLGREDDIGQINVPNALTQNEEKLLQNFRGLNEAEQLALLSISTAMQKNKKT